MAAATKVVCILGFLAIMAISRTEMADAAGECGESTTPDDEAIKLLPCVPAAQDENAAVPESCCSQVKQMGQNQACLCAVLLSSTTQAAGIDPKVTMTIPKRCNFPNPLDGYKCGPYNLP